MSNPKKTENETLETRVTKLEKFIEERLDSVVNHKINNTEGYLLEKIDELRENLESEIDDVRDEIPETYDLDSRIELNERQIEDYHERIVKLEDELELIKEEK